MLNVSLMWAAAGFAVGVVTGVVGKVAVDRYRARKAEEKAKSRKRSGTRRVAREEARRLAKPRTTARRVTGKTTRDRQALEAELDKLNGDMEELRKQLNGGKKAAKAGLLAVA